MGERRGTKALETWCKRVTQGYPGVKVENMTTSWRDGLAFCAMIHHFRPDLIDFASLEKSDVFGNNELAFRIAERHLGIPALLDAEDMAEYPVPDRLSILTYLSQFYQAFASNNSSPVKKSAESPDSSIVSLGNVQPSSKMEGAPPWRELCLVCGNPVYLAQRLRFEGKLYHRTCFRCARCDAQLSPAGCYETVDGRFCCETCPDEDITTDMSKDDEDEDNTFDKSAVSLSQKVIVDESPPSTPPPPVPVIVPHTRSKALPDVEPSPSHTASIVAMRKMLFDTYNKDTDDAKLIRVENNQKEHVHSSGVKKNDLSEIDDSSSRKISLVSNSETCVYTELDNKAKDSQFSKDSTPTDVRLCDENADSSIISDKESGNAENDNLRTETKISSELHDDETEKTIAVDEIKPPPRHRHTLKRNSRNADELPSPVVSVVVEPPPRTTPVKLNPFDDDDDEEVEETPLKQEVVESPRKSYNPFDSGSEDEEETYEVANASKTSSPALSPLRKAPSKNPFDSDEEDDDVTVTAPVPLPRKILETTPEPSPFPRSRLRASLTSLSSTYSTLSTQSTPRKKKPAPPPPPSPFNTLKSSPMHKKNRRAPLPPSVTSSRLSLTSNVVDTDPVNRSPSATGDNSKVPSGRSSPPPGSSSHQLAGESIANEISSIVDQIANLVETKREKDRLSLSVAEEVKTTSKELKESVPTDETESKEESIVEENVTLSSPAEPEETVKVTSPAEPSDASPTAFPVEPKEEIVPSPVQRKPMELPIEPKVTAKPPSLPAHPPPIDRPKPTSPLEPKVAIMTRKQSFSDEHKLRPVSMDVSSTSSLSSATYDDFSSPLSEKKSKDSVNLHRKISDGSGSPYSLNKSTHGQWKRKKAPAPPLPTTPTRRSVQPMPMQKIRQELNDIEIKQQGLERQGVTLENTIRNKFESGKSITPYVEDLVLQLFELVNEKNDLFRRQAELMALRRQHNLEEEQADIEYQIRCLMTRPEANKTDYDKELEEKLIRRLVEVVDMRNSIVDCLDNDRLREAEEDRSIHASLGYFSKTPEDKEEKKSKTLKKFYKKKKEKQGLKPAKSSCDLDKDFDETEKDAKPKKKKWYGLNTLKHKH